jgi:adenylosuccinate synthase
MIADVVVGAQYGDEGKGKIAHHLAKTGIYTHVLRYNGGCNAGHTIYHQNKKYITHHIPCGVFFGIKSIIGPGCVVSASQLLKEIEELEAGGIATADLICVAHNTHVITDEHVAEELSEKKIGTTRRGNGPAYRDKYARKGLRACDIEELAPYLIDVYAEFHENKVAPVILCEGAQGFGLDVDWGDYPYVTSSHCLAASAALNGIPMKAIRDIWGVGKIYETYVGSKNFESSDSVFKKIRKSGKEFGATTGRPRQINWLNLDLLRRSIKINGVNKLVLNKVDILQQVGKYGAIKNDCLHTFQNMEKMKDWIVEELGSSELEIYFSNNPYHI